MKQCRLEEIPISEFEPYKDDLLGRDKSGNILFQLVKSFSDGFVMAINGKWGSGKTTFVNMWQQQMKNEGYETIYYNAWENDHISDPLVGLIAEFKRKTDVAGKKQLKKFTNAISRISFSMVPSLLAILVKQYTGIDLEDLDKVAKDGSKEAMNLLNKSVDNYIKQQESIKDFKNALEEYIRSFKGFVPDKPIIFIIDELDRCKPDFAIKTLERIKHLFSVKNVVFVLAIDREQLSHSVRGFYGSDLIDADDYLRRFIDVQYNLPPGNVRDLVNKLFERFEYNNSVLNIENTGKDQTRSFKHFVESIYSNKDLSIRQLEKWMLHTRLVINQFTQLSPLTLSFIVFLHDYDIKFYNQFMNKDLNGQEILDHIVQIFTHSSAYNQWLNLNTSMYDIIAEILTIRYNTKKLFQENIIDKYDRLLLTIDNSISEIKLCDALNEMKNKPTQLLSNIHIAISDFNNIDY